MTCGQYIIHSSAQALRNLCHCGFDLWHPPRHRQPLLEHFKLHCNVGSCSSVDENALQCTYFTMCTKKRWYWCIYEEEEKKSPWITGGFLQGLLDTLPRNKTTALRAKLDQNYTIIAPQERPPTNTWGGNWWLKAVFTAKTCMWVGGWLQSNPEETKGNPGTVFLS